MSVVNVKSTTNFLKPVIDLQATGAKIKRLRKINGFSVHELQEVFGFEYPQAIYAWEQGKNIPSIDNMLVLAKLFNIEISELVVTTSVEMEMSLPKLKKTA